MEKFSAIKLRRHPGGLRGFITTIRILLQVWLFIATLFAATSLMMMFTSNIAVKVESRKSVGTTDSLPNLKHITQRGLYSFKARNVFDWFLFDRTHLPNVFTCVFVLLITWYTYKIFKSLELDHPFSLQIAKDIRFLGLLMIFAAIFSLLQGIYMHYVIMSLTEKAYKLGGRQFSFSFWSGIIVLIIAEVYRRGCELQEDKDLTV